MVVANQAGRKRTVTRSSAVKETSTYQYGNTVKQLQVVPKQYDESELGRPKLSNHTRKNRDKALYMNFGYVMFLAVAVVVTLFACISYLQLQAQMTEKVKSISSLKKEVADLRSDNDETYNRISTSVDLDYIKKVALEEMGMVYASKDQVVLYNNEESDYVRQYSDIPKAEPSK